MGARNGGIPGICTHCCGPGNGAWIMLISRPSIWVGACMLFCGCMWLGKDTAPCSGVLLCQELGEGGLVGLEQVAPVAPGFAPLASHKLEPSAKCLAAVEL